jgi:hypothetical protein
MNAKEFTIWLSGFLTNKNSIDNNGIKTITQKIEEVLDEPKVTLFPPNYPIPRTDIPDPLKPPFNPTCTTGKQLLADNYGPSNDDYGRKPPIGK